MSTMTRIVCSICFLLLLLSWPIMCMNAEPDLIDFFDVQEGEFDLFQYIAAEQQYEDEQKKRAADSDIVV